MIFATFIRSWYVWVIFPFFLSPPPFLLFVRSFLVCLICTSLRHVRAIASVFARSRPSSSIFFSGILLVFVFSLFYLIYPFWCRTSSSLMFSHHFIVCLFGEENTWMGAGTFFIACPVVLAALRWHRVRCFKCAFSFRKLSTNTKRKYTHTNFFYLFFITLFSSCCCCCITIISLYFHLDEFSSFHFAVQFRNSK